ncbi:MAG TPA: DUF1905 domain-containing protein [Actinomycetota bacterium]|nr:DUF1905 domain-containing protein [Actinomycetota bacterium]
MEFRFAGRVIEWRGPSPYYYLPVPAEEAADIREVAAMATYGWGVPLKDAVRMPQRIAVDDEIAVELTVRL